VASLASVVNYAQHRACIDELDGAHIDGSVGPIRSDIDSLV